MAILAHGLVAAVVDRAGVPPAVAIAVKPLISAPATMSARFVQQASWSESQRAQAQDLHDVAMSAQVHAREARSRTSTALAHKSRTADLSPSAAAAIDRQLGDGDRPVEPSITTSSYVPSRELQIPALPKSAPDPAALRGMVSTGLPIRLRLYVDAFGSVANVEVLQASELDADVVAQVKKMFYATGFLAGKRGGEDVASYMDVELSLADLM